MRRGRSKKGTVVSLHGALPAHGVPDEAIVEMLRSVLAKAEAGAISGVIIGWIGPSHEIVTRWEGKASSHEMIAASAMLHSKVMNVWLGNGEEVEAPHAG